MLNVVRINYRKIWAEEQLYKYAEEKYKNILEKYREFAEKEGIEKSKFNKGSGKPHSYKGYLIRLIILIQEAINGELELESENFIKQLDRILSDPKFKQYNEEENGFPKATINCYKRFWNQLKFNRDINEISYKANSLDEESQHLYIDKLYELRNPAVQKKFRKKILNKYSKKCMLCDINVEQLLIASHIKGYSYCKDFETAISDNNGLLLCVHHDALFDKGIISFDSSGKIIIAAMFKEWKRMLLIDEEMSILNYIVNNDEIKKNLEFHRIIKFDKMKIRGLNIMEG